MTRKRIQSAMVLLLAGVPAIGAAAPNVAFGKPVTLIGPFATGSAYFNSPPYTGEPGGFVDPTIVTDGVLQGGGWTSGVWWDEQHSGTHNYVIVDLQGTFELSELGVMADNNDRYLLEYRDTGGEWQTAWDIPEVWGSGGLQFRSTVLPAPVTATALRFSAVYVDTPGHDYAYSVTEIQTSAVPEPETHALMLAGLGLVACVAAARRAKERAPSPMAARLPAVADSK